MKLGKFVLATFAAMSIAVGAQAADYPSKNITLVVPFPPGGSTDLLARKIAEELGTRTGQTVIVDNRAGAGGTVGSRRVADSPADGYTLGIGVTGSHAISHSLYKSPSYDPVKDFQAISMIVSAPLVIAVNKDIPVDTLEDFIGYARDNRETLSFGTPGVGTSMHLTGEMFNQHAGTDILHVPFRGSANAMSDLLAGRIEVMFGDLLVLLPHIQSGDVKAIAVTSKSRHPLLPDVPAVGEAENMDGFEALSWQGLFAPADTPKEIVATLNEYVIDILATPEISEFFGKQGFIVEGTSSEEYADFLIGEKSKWAKIVADSGIPLN